LLTFDQQLDASALLTCVALYLSLELRSCNPGCTLYMVYAQARHTVFCGCVAPFLPCDEVGIVWQWLRPAAKRIGIDRRFRGVICLEATQSISIAADWRARVSTLRTLVFLQLPSAEDLRDTYTVGDRDASSSLAYTSPDAIEVSRQSRSDGTLTVFWLPRDPITLYTAYQHQNTWTPSGVFDGAAVYFEYPCDMRTGKVTLELVAPVPFETAVVFKGSRWPLQLTGRRLVRSALRHLEVRRYRPRIEDDGRRIEYNLDRVRVGERYVLVAFREHGVARCQEWLKETSLTGRTHRAVAAWIPTFMHSRRHLPSG
jgi:hypothetical protein